MAGIDTISAAWLVIRQGLTANGGVRVDGSRVQPTADVDDSAVLGPGTTVWHLAQIREDACLGRDCLVGRGAYVGPGGIIGDRVKLQKYALVYEPARLQHGRFLGQGVGVPSDLCPRSVDVTGGLERAD